MKTIVLISTLAITAAAHAQSLYNNATPAGLTKTGLEVSERGLGGFNSTPCAPNTVLGFGAFTSGGVRLADDFTLVHGGTVSSINLFAYQEGATTATIIGGNLEIRTGSPDGTIVATGVFGGSSLTNVYRVTSMPSTSSYRRIQMATFDFTTPGNTNNQPHNLNAGTYWITYNLTGSLAGGVWVSPLSKVGETTTLGANALQYASGRWAPTIDSGSNGHQDMPFWVNGQPVPEPGSFLALGLGAVALMRRRK